MRVRAGLIAAVGGLAALLAVLVPAGQASEIRRHSLQSAALAREFNYLVYIPDGYETAMAHYPVLYLLHGAGGDENSYAASGSIKETADRLIEAKAIPPTLIVMPGCSGWSTGPVSRKLARPGRRSICLTISS